jgi:phosphoadenosine phosphosulfate reductase
MYSYSWDSETGGLLLNSSPLNFSKEPRPVYYKELDILGFDQYWQYDKNDTYPYMWAEANNYFYRGRLVAKTKRGAIYTAPEIVVLEEPEPNGRPLRFVDIPAMVEKNREILEQLGQDTIKKIYNTYIKYKDKVDVFYVAFSGGKDSIVALDIVQRALPHNCFEVLFGDTDMEFPTTRSIVDWAVEYCNEKEISFYTAKADMSAEKSWDLFGAPARKLRWCCTVHKTAPVINKLCEIHEMKRIHAMMITGVRGDESVARSDYDELSMGKKLPGQYSYHPLLEWSSAEIYLYIYMQELPFNEAYKLGFNRVGCIMCPNSSERHEFIKRACFPEFVDIYCEKIAENSRKDLSGNNRKEFLETGGWKTRLSGRELKFAEDERFEYEEDKYFHRFTAINLKPEWKIWYKTIGDLYENSDSEYIMEYNGIVRGCFLKQDGDKTIFEIENLGKTKNAIEFVYYFKSILAKTQYCVQCKACVAECPYRNIEMNEGELHLSDECIRCKACLKMLSGCLYYNSVKGSKTMKSLKGLNRYLSVGVDADWIRQYLVDQTFEPGNRKTDVMYGLMNDAGMTSNKKLTPFGKFIQERDIGDTSTWALMLCNLAYTPAFGWYIHNIPFNEPYIESRLLLDMGEDATKKDGGKKARGEFWNGFKTILDSNSCFKDMGFGVPEIEAKETRTGDVKKSMKSIIRFPWNNPNPEVILYSLYKFAEACGDYYQFTLSRLLDFDVESDGISPAEIFGIDRATMEKILNGLNINHPDFITAQFNLDLDTITLNANKSSSDVLALL